MERIRLPALMLILCLLPCACACASKEEGAEEYREHMYFVFGGHKVLWRLSITVPWCCG